jgi:hypothetical protein
MAAFGAWLECAGTALARCLAERFAADEAVKGDNLCQHTDCRH